MLECNAREKLFSSQGHQAGVIPARCCCGGSGCTQVESEKAWRSELCAGEFWGRSSEIP